MQEMRQKLLFEIGDSGKERTGSYRLLLAYCKSLARLYFIFFEQKFIKNEKNI